MAELLSFWQSLKEYQLPYSQEQELHQSIAQLHDYIKGLEVGVLQPTSTLSETFNKYQNLLQMGVDIMNKYIDIASLSDMALKALIAENGYSYITDLLELEVEHLRSIVYFLPVIHALKGTIPGLVILLACFADKVDITEWWEDETRQMKRYTFNITVLRIRNMKFPSQLPNRIYEFCSQYVYPLLAHLEIQVSCDDSTTNVIYTMCQVSEKVIALVEANQYIADVRSAIANEFGAQYVDSNAVSNTENWTYRIFYNLIEYLFNYESKLDLQSTGNTDVHSLKIIKTNSSEIILSVVWGPNGTYGDAIYLGILDATTIQDKIQEILNLIHTVLEGGMISEEAT